MGGAIFLGDGGRVGLPQPYALRLELIRSRGYSNREVLDLVERRDEAKLKEQINAELGWVDFLEYANAHAAEFAAAVWRGYTFKFMTIGGLRSLLEIKFGLQPERDYQLRAGKFTGLLLDASSCQLLERLTPDYWVISSQPEIAVEGYLRVKIEHRYAASTE